MSQRGSEGEDKVEDGEPMGPGMEELGQVLERAQAMPKSESHRVRRVGKKRSRE